MSEEILTSTVRHKGKTYEVKRFFGGQIYRHESGYSRTGIATIKMANSDNYINVLYSIAGIPGYDRKDMTINVSLCEPGKETTLYEEELASGLDINDINGFRYHLKNKKIAALLDTFIFASDEQKESYQTYKREQDSKKRTAFLMNCVTPLVCMAVFFINLKKRHTKRVARRNEHRRLNKEAREFGIRL